MTPPDTDRAQPRTRQAEQVHALRKELAGAVSAVERELNSARARLASAKRNHEEAQASWRDLQRFATAGLNEGESLAGPIQLFLGEQRAALSAAEAERGAAKARVPVLEEQLSHLREAIDQLDRSLLADKKVLRFPARGAAPPPRRGPSRRRGVSG